MKRSAHPLADAAQVAKMLEELSHQGPAERLAEASALIESLEAETAFDAAHRIEILSLIDDAGRAAVDALSVGYVGADPRVPAGRLQDWRALSDYLEKLSSAFTGAAEPYAAHAKAEETRVALVVSKAMRKLIEKMRNGWLRYLPPDRAAWEQIAKCYQIATARKASLTAVKIYAAEPATCPAHELAAAVMLTAAVPQSLTPREIEVVCRIALRHGGAFARAKSQEPGSLLSLDLKNAAAPSLVRTQAGGGPDTVFFGPGAIESKLEAFSEPAGEPLLAQLGKDLSAADKLSAIAHAQRFWSPTPPARREPRTRINTPIQILVGVAALQRALGYRADVPEASQGAIPQQAVVHTGTLTDFSAHGIGARVTRRADGWLEVGSVMGFRLERSPQWAVGIVRRIRSDRQSQTDLGIEILAKAAELVSLEVWEPGTTIGNIVTVRSGAVLLPENPQLGSAASLLLQPATYNRMDTFIIHRGSGARRARLAATSESLGGWNRVDLVWLEPAQDEPGEAAAA